MRSRRTLVCQAMPGWSASCAEQQHCDVTDQAIAVAKTLQLAVVRADLQATSTELTGAEATLV